MRKPWPSYFLVIYFVLMLSITVILFAYEETGQFSQGPDRMQWVTLVTGGIGGTYYPVGTILTSLWNKVLKTDKIKVSTRISGGSIDNLSMLRSGEVSMGIAVASIVYDAQKGLKEFKKEPYNSVRLITGLWPEYSQFLVLRDSDIHSLSDIEGKRFSVGGIGSGTESSSLFILKTLAKLSPGAGFENVHLGYIESVSAMQNKLLDGVNIEAGIPTSTVSEALQGDIPMKLLNFTQAEYNIISAKDPNYGFFTIPAGTYPTLDEDINTIGVKSALISDANVSETLVYNLVKTLYDDIDDIKSFHPTLSLLSKKRAIQNIPHIKLHAGAVRYYEEEGIFIPEDMR